MDGLGSTATRWSVQRTIPWGQAAILRDGVPMLITAAAAGETPDEHMLFAAQVASLMEHGLPDDRALPDGRGATARSAPDPGRIGAALDRAREP